MSTASRLHALARSKKDATIAGIKARAGVRGDYNENHDPKNGEFTFGEGGSSGAGHAPGKSGGEAERDIHARAAEDRGNKSAARQGATRTSEDPHSKWQGRDTGKNWEAEARARIAARDSGKGKTNDQNIKDLAAKGGVTHMDKDALAKHIQTGHYSMLTAANPGDARPGSKKNAEQMVALHKDLARAGVKVIPSVGNYDGMEPSLMAIHNEHFGDKEAEALGKKYGQASVMHVHGGEAKMKFVTGEHAGSFEKSTKMTFDPKLTNYYTGIQGTHFSFDLPDNTWSAPSQKE